MGNSLCKNDTQAQQTEPQIGGTEANKPEIKSKQALNQVEESQKQQDIQKITKNLNSLIQDVNKQGAQLRGKLDSKLTSYRKVTEKCSEILQSLNRVAFLSSGKLSQIKKGIELFNIIPCYSNLILSTQSSFTSLLLKTDFQKLLILLEQFSNDIQTWLEIEDFSQADYNDERKLNDIKGFLSDIDDEIRVIVTQSSQIPQPNWLIPYSIVQELKETPGGKFWLNYIDTISLNFQEFIAVFLRENKIPSDTFDSENFIQLIDKNHDNAIDIFQFTVFVRVNSDLFNSEGILKNNNLDEIQFSTFRTDNISVLQYHQPFSTKYSEIFKFDIQDLRKYGIELNNSAQINGRVFQDGTKYLGDLTEDKLNGQGIYVRSNSQIVYGDWVDGKPIEGIKLLLFPNNLIVVAQTDRDLIINDSKAVALQADKQGRLKQIYQGEVDRNLIQIGVLFYPNAENEVLAELREQVSVKSSLSITRKAQRYYKIGVYEGLLLNDSKEGQGQFSFYQGNQFSGCFKNNQMEQGSLKVIDPNTQQLIMTFEGVFDQGSVFQNGKVIYSSGGVYEGEIDKGLRHGQGKYIYQNGNVYDGMWVYNKQEGKGSFKYNNKDSYEGDFKNGVFDGNGKYTYADGKSYEGQWRQDMWNGRGIFKDSDGKILKDGIYSNNVLLSESK